MLDRIKTTEDALALFDASPAVTLPEMIGRWRGSSVATGHRQDGLLEALGWYGKEFVDEEHVRPLLFGPRGETDVDSRLLPYFATKLATPGPIVRTLFALVRPLLSTTKPRARLRTIEHRGLHTAAMIYDWLPIIDVFRKLDDDTLLGVMDQRGVDQPFFFVLRRER